MMTDNYRIDWPLALTARNTHYSSMARLHDAFDLSAGRAGIRCIGQRTEDPTNLFAGGVDVGADSEATVAHHP
jgi:hypothetical protein